MLQLWGILKRFQFKGFPCPRALGNMLYPPSKQSPAGIQPCKNSGCPHMHVNKDSIKGKMLAELIAHFGSLVEQRGQGKQGGASPGRKNKSRRVHVKAGNEKVTTEEVSATPAAGAAAKAGTE